MVAAARPAWGWACGSPASFCAARGQGQDGGQDGGQDWGHGKGQNLSLKLKETYLGAPPDR